MKTHQITAFLAFGMTTLCSAQTTGVQCVAEINLHKGLIDGGGGGIAAFGDLVAHTEGADFDVKLYDATDRSDPILLSTIPGLGYNDTFGARVALGQDRLVASNPYKDMVLIVDTTTPSSPVIGATLSLDPRQILIQDHTLFVRTTSTVEIYDISDVANPVFVNSLLDTNTYGDMAVAGNLIVVPDTSAGLRLLDASDPANVSEVSLFPISNNGRVAVQDDIVAVSDGLTFSTQFIDISDPSNPAEIASSGIPITTPGFSFVDNYLLYPATTGVHIYDISSIAAPQFEGVIAGPEVLNSQFITSVGEELAMISGSYFSIMDIQDDPGMNSLIYNGDPISPTADLNGLFVDGNYAFTYDSDSNSLLVIDVSDPQSPTQTASYSPSSTIFSIEYQAGVVFLGLSGDVVEAIDVSDPLSPTSINSWSVSELAIKIQQGGDYLYVLAGNESIEVYDISSLLNPMLVSTISDLGFNEKVDLRVEGDRLVFIDYSQGGGFSGNHMYVYDISDPLTPVELNHAPGGFGPLLPDYYAGGLQMDGHLLYVTLGGYYHGGPSIYNGQFASYDISDDVEQLDALIFRNIDSDVSDGAKLGRIMLDGNHAYVTSRHTGGSLTNQSIALFDMTDPQDLKYIGASGVAELLPSGSAVKQGDSIYLAASGFAIFDASTDCAATCPADLTGDGYLDFFDVSAFLIAYNAQDPIADFTNDGIWDFFDVSAFLSAFNAGCP